MIQDYFIPLMAGIGGGLIGAFLVRTKRPDWIKEVVKAECDAQWAVLRRAVEDQQNKVGQAYQVLGHWVHHFEGGTKPSEAEMELALDYFGINENYDPKFLSIRVNP